LCEAPTPKFGGGDEAQCCLSVGVDRIFQFDTIDDGKLKLRDEIKTRDFILVDGSKEMEMAKMVDEIKEM